MFARAPVGLIWRGAVVVVVLIAAVVACTVMTAQKPVAQVVPTASPTLAPTASPSPSPSPTPVPTPKPTPSPLLSQRITILVLGSDSTPQRLSQGLGKLTDSIMVLSVNAKHTKVSMMSFPRDIVDIPMGTGETWPMKINSISYYRGEAAMKRAMAYTIGHPIDYYIEVNMTDFSYLVNAIGGIDVYVRQAIYDPSIRLSISAGRHHIGGAVALKYARSRHTTSDWDRASRQQQILAAVIRKLVDPKTKINVRNLLPALRSLKTDMPLSELGAFLQVARLSAKAKVVGGVMAPPQFAGFTGIEPGSNRGWIQEPNLVAIRAYARSLLAD